MNAQLIEVDFGSGQSCVYVNVADRGVVATSVVVATMGISRSRDFDEMELTAFNCSIVSKQIGIGYTVIVADYCQQATGKFIINAIRI